MFFVFKIIMEDTTGIFVYNKLYCSFCKRLITIKLFCFHLGVRSRPQSCVGNANNIIQYYTILSLI